MTLWRILCETCSRTDELPQINIEDLNLTSRSAPVKSKGAKPRTHRRPGLYRNLNKTTPKQHRA
ncbi:hypothetical protein [Nocardia sp. NPDC051463]|uniref:hypothetical protein n=1 Tax=Nocardia sp. NPDC051463 TaxID=3154845 RepID=UPI00344B7A4F